MNKAIVIRLGLLALIGAGIFWGFQHRDMLSAEALQAQLESAGPWAPVVLLLIWLAAPVFFVPGAPITLAAGFLFGPLFGGVYSLVGATAGATMAFLISRHMGGDWVERRAQGRIGQLKSGIESGGWRFVAFVRLVPLFPFNLLNYALGLTRIPLGSYTLTTFLAMAPGTFGFAYLGYAGRETLAGGEGWVTKALIGLSVFAALALLPLIIRGWRRTKAIAPATLAEWLREGRDVRVVDVRTAEEYAGPQGRITPSTLIPIDQLAGRAEELAEHRDKPLVLV